VTRPGEHRREGPARLLYATLAALALLAGAVFISTRQAPTAVSDGAPLSVAEECQRALGYPARTSADRVWLRTCVHALTPPTTSPSGSPTATPPPSTTATPTTTPPVTVPPTTTPAPTTVPPTTTPPGPGECPAFPGFPDASCTGWQHTGVTLTECSEGDGDQDGHLTIANRTYDGCVFPRGVVVQAAGIIINRSRIVGVVRVHDSLNGDYRGAKLTDVEIDGGANPSPDFAAISAGSNISCVRCHIHGTATGFHLGDNNVLRDSYIHDFVDTGSHGAAAGTGQGAGDNTIVEHNNLQCSRTNGAAHCSSALSLYDEPTLNNVLVQFNLFNSVSGYGMYGGGPQGTNIRILDNVFGQKYYPTCGLFGPVAAFYVGNAGNIWSGNKYENGSVVNPSSNT
jgi:hypothetical protein